MTFARVLIANRGEIAARVASSCHKMGIETVGLYSDDDRESPYLEGMGQTVHLPGSTARDTYLNQDAVLAAAQATGAQAIHPGYGFLAENESFIQRCANEGLVFIGPSYRHVALMGEKRQAREAFAAAGFPVVPRYHLSEAGIEESAVYPVIVKAASGGGGIGMTLVKSAAEIERAVKRVSAAGEKYFGSGEVYAERYLEGARHIEVQVVGDGTNAIHLGERDCSWQRRYQKVVEESPAPNLAADLRERITSEAARAVRELGYENVGTVECLVVGGEFFFLEMNTRIQVEHGVTEMVRGVDLVEWQLRVAAGEKLPAAGIGSEPSGHAIEFRLYAEDPETFYPSPGTLTAVAFPSGPGIRVDTAVRAGTVLSMQYDPMIAKIIVHGPTRDEAIARARVVLDATVVAGVKNNLPFLRKIAASAQFASGVYSTGTLAELQKQG
jgi:acetyl-CoA carboxylase biotin carboxylase subunit